MYRSADAFNHDYVLCLKPEDLIRYAANWRMRGKSKFGLFFTPNPEEFSDA